MCFHRRFSSRATCIVTSGCGVSSYKFHWELKEPKTTKSGQVHWRGVICTVQRESECVCVCVYFPSDHLFTPSIALAEKIEKYCSLDIQNTIVKHLKIDFQLNPSFGIKLRILQFLIFLPKKRFTPAHLLRTLFTHWSGADCTWAAPFVAWLHASLPQIHLLGSDFRIIFQYWESLYLYSLLLLNVTVFKH